MDYAVLFPGQGSQVVGMGEVLFDELPDLLGDKADEVLGWSLRQACLEGPQEHLTRTEIAQPALYALSFAAWTLWSKAVGSPPVAAAGHSLGEYTALAAGGALDFFDGLGLVAERGAAMAAAAARVESGMAAVLGADADHLEAVCSERRLAGGSLWVANLNAPGQTVVAGVSADIDWLIAEAGDLGLRRVVPLDVTGAFHTPLMEPAAARLLAKLAGTEFAELLIEVWSNVDAAPYGHNIGEALLRQLTSPVRFAESLIGLGKRGVTTFVQLGPGDVTLGMARRSVDGSTTLAAADSDSVKAAAAELGLSIE